MVVGYWWWFWVYSGGGGGDSLCMHNCFVALSCDAPESKEKLKGHQISEKFDTNEEFK